MILLVRLLLLLLQMLLQMVAAAFCDNAQQNAVTTTTGFAQNICFCHVWGAGGQDNNIRAMSRLFFLVLYRNTSIWDRFCSDYQHELSTRELQDLVPGF